jgi:hypothetical protein
MAVTVRSLLARVQPFRPDLKPEMAMFGLRDALTRIASQTLLLKQTELPEVVSGGTLEVDYSTKDNVRTLRIDNVYSLSTYTIRTQNGIDTAMEFQAYWDAATDTPNLPAAGAGNVGHYYIVDTAGTYSGTSYVVGDVIFSNGTTWKKYLYNNSEPTGTSFDAFRLMKEHNKPTDESWRRNYSASRSGWPDAWAQENGTIFIIPPAREELIIRVTRSVDYSDLIVADVDTVDLPPDIERVMIAGALEFVYNLPGDGQDKNMAQKYRMEYHRGLSNLKGTAIFGYGGVPMYNAGGFAGTGGVR